MIDGHTAGEIGPGLLVLMCAEPRDTEAQSDKLLAKILKLRIFGDAAGKMNNSIQGFDQNKVMAIEDEQEKLLREMLAEMNQEKNNDSNGGTPGKDSPLKTLNNKTFQDNIAQIEA